MEIGALGYNYKHDKDFVMERPEGTGCYLLLLIKEPSVFVIRDVEQKVPKNSVVLFSPETPYRYWAAEEVYVDDWMYFNVSPEEGQRLRDSALCDEIYQVTNMEELSQLMRFMAFEFQSRDPYHEEILEYYTKIFFYKLYRMVKRNSTKHSQNLLERYDVMFHMRNLVYSEPEANYDVSTLAVMAGMSRSGFQHLYKKIFGVNVMEDVVESRIIRAKNLLRSTNLSVKQVGEKSGYTNTYSFMRQFKERVGKTPTQYRNCV